MRRSIVIGDKFGTRTVVATDFSGRRPGYRRFHLHCECGAVSIQDGYSFLDHGCSECSPKAWGAKKKYGTHRWAATDRLYKLWASMRSRCRNREGWADRGITVCQEWDRSFLVFEKWAFANGYSAGLTIDRVDANGNYEPGNCEWVSRGENSRRSRQDHRMVRLQKLPADGLLSFGC